MWGKLERVKSIDNVEVSLNPIKSAIELRATFKAHAMLKEAFSEIDQFSPRKEKGKEEENEFGVG